MNGTGTTRVTGTLTHSANTTLGRTLAIDGTLELAGGYINKSGTPVVRNTGTIKRTAASATQIYAAIDNDGLVEGVDLEGGGTGSTGDFTGVRFAGNTTFELADGAALTNMTLAGATLNVTGTVTASGTMSSGTVGGAGTLHVNGPFTWSGGTMSGAGTTRVTGVLTHSGNTMLTEPRVLANEGTINMAGGYINKTGAPADPQHRHDQAHGRGRGADLRADRQRQPRRGRHARRRRQRLDGRVRVRQVRRQRDLRARPKARSSSAPRSPAATLNATGTVIASGATTLSSGTLGGTGTFVLSGPTTWSGGAMTGAGTTRVTGVMTHTANTALAAARVLLVEGTLDSPRAINGSGGAAIRVTGTYKGTGSTTAAVDNDGLVQGIELGGGGKDTSTGEFSGATLKAGTFEVGGKLTSDAAIAGATVNGTVNVVAAQADGRDARRRDRGHRHARVDGRQDGWPGATTKVTGTLVLNGISSLATGRVLENRGPDRPARHGDGVRRRLRAGREPRHDPQDRGHELDDRRDAAQRRHGRRPGRRAAARGRHRPARHGHVHRRRLRRASARSRARWRCPGTVEIADDLTVREGDTLTIAGTAVQRAGTLRGNLDGERAADVGRRAPRRARAPRPSAPPGGS